ncbi:MAG TPA: sulfur carrier protein ThiS [Pyrinomonadaceae bacterium]|nr:sulfur carrier protein ThiS [Pyrinomonadaceae bacterium]
MFVEINGEARDVPASINLSDLVRHLALAPERLAIELNRQVIRRADWPSTTLQHGDRIEIVHFVGGGEKQG